MNSFASFIACFFVANVSRSSSLPLVNAAFAFSSTFSSHSSLFFLVCCLNGSVLKLVFAPLSRNVPVRVFSICTSRVLVWSSYIILSLSSIILLNL